MKNKMSCSIYMHDLAYIKYSIMRRSIHIWSPLWISHSLNIVTKKRDWVLGYKWPMIKLMRSPDDQPTVFAVPILKWQIVAQKNMDALQLAEHLPLQFSEPLHRWTQTTVSLEVFQSCNNWENHISKLVILLASGLKHLLCTRCAMSPGLVKMVFWYNWKFRKFNLDFLF